MSIFTVFNTHMCRRS